MSLELDSPPAGAHDRPSQSGRKLSISGIDPDSSRLEVVTNIITCVLSSSLFLFPLFFRTYGVVLGVGVVLLCHQLNYWTSSIIFQVHDRTKKHTMVEMVEAVLGPRAAKVAKVTFFLDYFSNYLIAILFSWNICQYILYFTDQIGYENVRLSNVISFKHYQWEMVTNRVYFILFCFLVVTPLLIRSSHRVTRAITALSFVVWTAFLAYTVYDLRSFGAYYQGIRKLSVSYFKPFSTDYFKYSFIVLTAAYIQPSLLSMQAVNEAATGSQLQTPVRKAFVYLTAATLAFGLYCYFHLGDLFTHDLFFLRAPFPGKPNEQVYLGILAVLGVFSMLFVRFYHSNMEGYMHEFVKAADGSLLLRLAPWTAALLLALIYPHIIDTIGYMSCTVFLADGYLFPILMKAKILREDGEQKRKVVGCFVVVSLLCFVAIVCLMTLAGDAFMSDKY